MENDRIVLENNSGHKVYSNVASNCNHCLINCNSPVSRIVDCEINKEKRRQGKKNTLHGTVYFCTNNEDLVRSAKRFNTVLETYSHNLSAIEDIKISTKDKIDIENQQLLHNIVKLNGLSGQNVENLVKFENIGANYHDQIKNLKKLMYDKPDEWAIFFLEMIKLNDMMRAEITAIEDSPNLRKYQYSIKTMLLNTFHIYMKDFNVSKIYFKIDHTTKSIYLDNATFQVALTHIVQNATKYAAYNSDLHVYYSETPTTFTIHIDMVSLQIKDDEIEKIMENGYSGDYARELERHGRGLGMSIVQKYLAFNNAIIKTNVNVNKRLAKTVANFPYENNIFDIVFDTNFDNSNSLW
jgi:hypothetical protein